MDMVIEKYKEGDIIVRDGDPANSFYVIKSVWRVSDIREESPS